jgi:hypothetical protein
MCSLMRLQLPPCQKEWPSYDPRMSIIPTSTSPKKAVIIKQRFQAWNSSRVSTGSKIRYNCPSTNLLLFVLLRFPCTLEANALIRHKNSFWKIIFCQRFQHVHTSYSCSLKSHFWRKAPTNSQPDARRRSWSAPRSSCYTPEEDPVPIVQEAGWFSGSVWTTQGI